MTIYLVNPGVDLTLELFVHDDIEEAIAIQFERIKEKGSRDVFVRKLEDKLHSLLADCLDWDLREPTEAQLTYATLVAKQLGISLPVEVRKYRFHMALFLDANVPKVRELQLGRSPQSARGEGAGAARRLVEMRENVDAASKDKEGGV